MSDNGHRAVSLAHMLWIESEDDEDAIEEARRELAEMDYDDLAELDFEVVDFTEDF